MITQIARSLRGPNQENTRSTLILPQVLLSYPDNVHRTHAIIFGAPKEKHSLAAMASNRQRM